MFKLDELQKKTGTTSRHILIYLNMLMILLNAAGRQPGALGSGIGAGEGVIRIDLL